MNTSDTNIGTSISNVLTRNETRIPTSFINFGTTSSNRNINVDEYIIQQSNNVNSFTQYKNNSGSIGSIVGSVNGDLILRPMNLSTKKVISCWRKFNFF